MNAYPKYKDSGIDWLGKIPEHWSKIATKRLFEIYSGATPQSDNEKFWDGDIIWVTPADYNTSDHYISSSKRTISKDGYNSCSTVLAPKGCIVFSKRAPIGKVAIADVELCTNQGCLCCVPHEGANSNYYYYLMSILNHFYNQLGSGSTFLEISAQSFADFSLILPSHAEQEAIAQYLDIKTAKINKLMAEKANQVENLRSYRTSVITEAVTHGLNPDAPLRQSGIDWIGEIPEHWIVTKLGRVLDGIQDGTHGSYNRVDVGHPLLSAKNVTEDGIIISDNESLINETDYNNIIQVSGVKNDCNLKV
jgi:type I restriction enzyme S subunit